MVNTYVKDYDESMNCHCVPRGRVSVGFWEPVLCYPYLFSESITIGCGWEEDFVSR